MGQPRLAERRRHRHHRDAAHAVRRADGHDTVPHIDATKVTIWLSIALAAGLAAAGLTLRLGKSRRGAPPPVPRELRSSWRMPPLTLLKPVTGSPALKLGMLALRGYLVVAVLLLLIKAIQLGTHRARGHSRLPARAAPRVASWELPGALIPPVRRTPARQTRFWAPAALRTVQPEAYITKPRSAEPIKAIRGRRGG